MKAMANELVKVGDLHVEFTILWACWGSTRLAFSLRAVAPSDVVVVVCGEADDIMHWSRRTFCHMSNVDASYGGILV